MTGKAYYITTLGDWQRHAARFANSHWLALDQNGSVGARYIVPGELPWHDSNHQPTPPAEIPGPDGAPATAPLPEIDSELPQPWQASLAGTIYRAPTAENPTPEGAASSAPTTATSVASDDATRILVLIEADEGVHLALEDDPAFEALPHPLAQKPISDAAQSVLAPHGVVPGATTFDTAEALARVHPLLRHRVF